LRLRNPSTPNGYQLEVLIDLDRMSKMNKLLTIVGGRILLKEIHETYIKLIVEKTAG
jgi:hypothetical protein